MMGLVASKLLAPSAAVVGPGIQRWKCAKTPIWVSSSLLRNQTALCSTTDRWFHRNLRRLLFQVDHLLLVICSFTLMILIFWLFVADFIALELESGNPRLLIDFGSGTLELKIKLNKTTHRLDDGDWHRLDIFWDTENVRMVLDLCRYATIYEPEDGTASVFNTSACEVKGVIPPFNEYLDVSSPLQIGGVSHTSLDPSQFRWDHLPHGKGFSGCIRNFVHNSKVI